VNPAPTARHPKLLATPGRVSPAARSSWLKLGRQLLPLPFDTTRVSLSFVLVPVDLKGGYKEKFMRASVYWETGTNGDEDRYPARHSHTLLPFFCVATVLSFFKLTSVAFFYMRHDEGDFERGRPSSSLHVL